MLRISRWALALAFFTCSALCSPVCTRSPYAVKESHKVPSKWLRVGPAPEDHLIHLQIGLKQNRFDELERHLYEVSDPYHHRYGQHLSAAEVNELVKPSDEAIALVEDWLSDHGIERFDYSAARDWVAVTLPVNVVNRLLDTKYYIFRHVDDDEVAIRTPEWSLPSHLHDHVEAVQPTNSFFRPRIERRTAKPPARVGPPSLNIRSGKPPARIGSLGKKHKIPTYEELVEIDVAEHGHLHIPNVTDLPSHPTAAQACNPLAVSILCLRTLYGTLNYVPQVPEKNQIALLNYLGQVSNRSDVNIFLEINRPEAAEANVAYKFKTIIVADGDDQQTPNTTKRLEGDLDSETILGIGFPIPLISYNVGGKPPFNASDFTSTNTNEPYLTWLQYVLAQPNLPQVITTSYADEEQTVPYAYAKRVCEGFAQLGARGISVLFGSGDQGVGHDGKCVSNDGSKKKAFLPSFPATCPFVTAVGSTRHVNPEMVAFDARTDFVSGGGFSNYFSRPRYQDKAVGTYLTDHLGGQFDGLYNKEGRGIPDISAQGYHYLVVWNGTSQLTDGTSASSPAMAAIISLVNDALISKGKPPLGFLNPWIYSKGFQAFTDVTIGSARGCNTTGFPAAKGWDPATGFGTPWFPKLKDVAMDYNFRAGRPWYYGPPW